MLMFTYHCIIISIMGMIAPLVAIMLISAIMITMMIMNEAKVAVMFKVKLVVIWEVNWDWSS